MLVVVAAAFPWSASSARGQIPKKDAAVSWLYMVPGTVADRYARTLENLGLLPERSAAVRDGSEFWMLSAEEYRTPEGVSSVTPPWHGVYRTTPSNEKRWGLLPVRTQSSFNTAFPFHRGNGPVWHGKGFTQSLEGGWFGRWGPLALVLNPVWFRAENRDFVLAPTGMDGEGRFRSPLESDAIDIPQRFGDEPYQVLSLGASSLRLNMVGLTVGVSSSPQVWGPGDLHPLVMGAAAGGIPHVFVGTSNPFNAWIADLDFRYMAGRTERSRWFGLTGDDRFALLNGFSASIRPRGLPGLQLGATRLFHQPWPSADGMMRGLLKKPFEGILKTGLQGVDQRLDDQFVSVFARWMVTSAGAEVWLEFVRGDHSVDGRWLLLEPEDFGGYAVGFRKTWRSDSAFTVFHAEGIVSGTTHRERGGARLTSEWGMWGHYPGAIYGNSSYRIGGWTHRGQLLTTSAGPFGNGQSLGVDHYSPNGHWSVSVDRSIVLEQPAAARPSGEGVSDVLYVVSGSSTRFLDRWDIGLGIDWVMNLNRHLNRASDAMNIRLQATVSRRFAVFDR
ncbi:hypothetical protein OAJ07_05230 [Gemmatimonadales bacterium]|nr:hypothetical protein [Gemmatimonadales bacterium]